MEHKILKFEKATQKIDIDAIKENKNFQKKVISAAIAASVGFVGIGTALIGNATDAALPAFVGVAMQVISHGIVLPSILRKKDDIDEEEMQNDISGGMKL